MAYEDRYKGFESYLTPGEPGVEARARNWSMAIGFNLADSCLWRREHNNDCCFSYQIPE